MEREIFSQVEEFREGRLKKIKEGKAPVPLDRGKFIIHLVPEQVLKDPFIEFDLSKIQNDVRAHPLFGRTMSPGPLIYNFDGILCRGMGSENPVFSYVQFFRNGTIEAIEDFYLNREDKEIPIIEYEQELLIKTGHYLEQLENLGVQPPVFFLLSILGAAEYKILRGPFQKDEMLFMPKAFTSEEHDPFKILRPILDQLWQAAGKTKSPSFDKSGQYHM